MKLTICKKNKIVYLTVFGLLLYICGFGTASETLDKSQTKKKSRGWLVADFPSPTEQGMSIVDPDGILSLQHRDALSNRLDAVDLVVNVDDLDVPVQMAVVVVEKMDLHQFGQGVDEEEAAENFARSLHDTWGVGYDTKLGGTGVLIFLSVYDRVVYVSRGRAVETFLTNSRIDGVIHSIRPAMKQAKYAQGLIQAIDELSEHVKNGPPTWKENIMMLFQPQYLFLCVWVGMLVNGIWGVRRRREEQRLYAQASSQLSEIDRAQAEALQGQYQATSCPICLEDFKSSTVGSDDQPIKLLRCGHVFDESCWSEWVSSGQGDVTKCPICQKDVGQPVTATATAATAAPNNNNNNDRLAMQQLVADDDRDDRDDRDRVVQRFQQERNFRLQRLALRFPRYITANQLQQWTSPTYNGPLVRDPSFVQRDPSVIHNNGRAGSGGGSGSGRPVSFGGGRSAGGRGGRF